MAKLKENSKIVKASGEELIATEPKVLSMIQENAYVHPATHPASMITGLHNSAITGVAGSVAWDNVTDKPSTFEPSAHTHTASQVGLGNVQNYGIATKAQAEEGTANNVYMTPLRVANALDLIKDALFPSGGIIMWSGAVNDIPVGWALCDGSNGTPDLRDRFIVGAGGAYSVGDTGVNAGSDEANENGPPYYALAYIMKL